MTKVLITGGTGSLGRALCARILQDPRTRVFIYSRDEGKHAIYYANNPRVNCIVGDVRDERKFRETIEFVEPNVVYHAAALKRIDACEQHPDECVKTNVLGSEIVARACFDSNVRNCILVSTDKACRAVNAYGSSKLMAEKIFVSVAQRASSSGKGRFCCVRYGNVIASRGSFLPLWLQRALKNEVIPVTDKRCTRFLFTLNDAVELLFRVFNNAENGEIVVPKMAAASMEEIIALIPTLDPKLKDHTPTLSEIGIRAGEKLHEDLVADTEIPLAYDMPSGDIALRPTWCRLSMRERTSYTEGSVCSANARKLEQGELRELLVRGLREANETS